MTAKSAFLPLLLLGVFCLPSGAWAGKTVFAPYVEKGAIEIENKSGYVISDDDAEDAWETEFSAAYGVTGFWETEIGVAIEDGGRGEDADWAALLFENKFQLAQPGTFFIDPGLKLEYARSLNGGPDEIGAKLLLAKQFGDIGNVANFSIEREIGEDSSDDNGYGFAYAVNYAVRDDLAFGLEWYSDFGDFGEDWDDESHQIGPVAYGELAGLEYEAGILAGVSDGAPDAELKLVLGYEF